MSSNFYYKPKNSHNLYYFYDWRHCIVKGLDLTIQGCFSILYADGVFLESIFAILVDYDSAGVEGCWWYYPDLTSPYPDDVFYGVCFEIGFDSLDTKVYVKEQVSFDYAKKACKRFIELHPEHEDFLTNIIDNWKPLNINTR